jgi:hypothetical protein
VIEINLKKAVEHGRGGLTYDKSGQIEKRCAHLLGELCIREISAVIRFLSDMISDKLPFLG